MDADPTPGNPEEVRELADALQTFADDVDEALGRVRGMAKDRAVLDWAGLSAEAFRAEFDGVPGNLQKLQTSYDMAAQALQTVDDLGRESLFHAQEPRAGYAANAVHEVFEADPEDGRGPGGFAVPQCVPCGVGHSELDHGVPAVAQFLDRVLRRGFDLLAWLPGTG